jgi:SPP1 gp7 family putative phage head morphogenesis protein
MPPSIDFIRFAERQKALGLIGSVNGAILDHSILHSIFIERLKTNEVNAVVSFLNNEVFPDIANTLERRLARITARGYDSNVWKTKRYQAMLKSIHELIRAGLVSASVDVKKSLSDIGVYEAQFQQTLLNRTLEQAGVLHLAPEVILPSNNMLRSIMTSKPFEGRLLKDWWKGLETHAQATISSQINIGITTGESTPKIVRRVMGTSTTSFVDGALHTTRRHASTIVRTAISHVASQAREMLWAENSDIIKGVKYVAVLDGRTTDICRTLDGQVFGIYEGPRPPMHHQCRSTTVAVTRSWKELGINLKEAPLGTRASMNGLVPANVTYAQWIRRQPVEFQNEVMGKGKAALYRRGVVPMDKFIDRKYKPLTLDQLVKLEDLMLSR